MTWVLILFASIGAISENDSNAMTSVDGFVSQRECEDAGAKARGLANGVKEIRFVCVARTGRVN